MKQALFAVAPPGLELALAAELSELGIQGTGVQGGVEWEGDVASMRLANLHLRTATRVLLRLAEFRARSFIELERHAARIPWSRVLSSDTNVSLRVTSKKSKLYHERAIAERLHALHGAQAAGAIDEEEGASNVQLIVVRVLRDTFTISADTSGEALHRRGYRQAIAQAPLRESIAAALLQYAQWAGDRPLLDPMCGSGTIPIEAALRARRIAPGLVCNRDFAFTSWPDHDEAAWQSQQDAARAMALSKSPVRILGSDRNAGAVEQAVANAERAGVAEDIEWGVRPLSAAEIPGGAALVTNPPYGVRISDGRDLRDLYAALGRIGRERVTGGVALLAPEGGLQQQLGVEFEPAASTRNGGIRVSILTRPAVAGAGPSE